MKTKHSPDWTKIMPDSMAILDPRSVQHLIILQLLGGRPRLSKLAQAPIPSYYSKLATSVFQPRKELLKRHSLTAHNNLFYSILALRLLFLI